MKQILVLFFCLVNLSSCYPQPRYHHDLYEHAAWLQKQEVLFNDYLGKTIEEIESLFGKPSTIYQYTEEQLTRKTPYDSDDIRTYRNVSIGQALSYKMFYKNKRLVHVDAGG